MHERAWSSNKPQLAHACPTMSYIHLVIVIVVTIVPISYDCVSNSSSLYITVKISLPGGGK